MLDPKQFYRKMDSMLKKIGMKAAGKNFLLSIIEEIEKTVGETVFIANGRLYHKSGNNFVFLGVAGGVHVPGSVKRLPIESLPVRRVSGFGTYIFDKSQYTNGETFATASRDCAVAAFLVQSASDQWIVVFDLRPGWSRDEVTFSLNAIRAALSQRILGDGLKNDLEQAAQIQQSLMPIHSPKLPGYEIVAHSQPAEAVGGDFFDFFSFDDGVFASIIGDASGHGLPAALLVRDVITGLRMGLHAEMKMTNALKKLNQVIQRNTFSTRFVSLIYGEIEDEGNFAYVNAGHPRPLLAKGRDVTELKTTGTILGALPEIALHRAIVQIEPGAVLVMFSDGITERKNKHGEYFGEGGIQEILVAHPDSTALELQELIFDAAFEFGELHKWRDDSTVVIIKRIE